MDKGAPAKAGAPFFMRIRNRARGAAFSQFHSTLWHSGRNTVAFDAKDRPDRTMFLIGGAARSAIQQITAGYAL